MTYLNSNQLKQYNEEGYVAPLDVLTKEEALEMFKDNPFKVQLITNKVLPPTLQRHIHKKQ